MDEIEKTIAKENKEQEEQKDKLEASHDTNKLLSDAKRQYQSQMPKIPNIPNMPKIPSMPKI